MGTLLAAGLWLAACGGTSATTGPTPPAGSPAASPAASLTGVPTPVLTAATQPSLAPATAPVSTPATPPESAAPTPAPTVAAPTPAATPEPSKGPAKGTFTGKGTKGLTATVTVSSIACQLPNPAGLQIFVLGQFGKNGPALNMHITATSLFILVATGAGTAFRERDFTGTGITSFDPATGAQIDSQLVETTPASANSTGIGKLASLSGSIDCGNQQPGSSTLVLTATTPEGEVNGMLDPVRVNCNNSAQYGKNVQAFGVISVGSTRVTAIVNVNYLGWTAYLTGTGVSHFYSSTDTTAATIGDNGAQISGDAATTPAAGEAPLTIHVGGADVCGTSTSGP